MALSKNRKHAIDNIDLTKSYNLNEASTIIKENSKVNFDATVE